MPRPCSRIGHLVVSPCDDPTGVPLLPLWRPANHPHYWSQRRRA